MHHEVLSKALPYNNVDLYIRNVSVKAVYHGNVTGIGKNGTPVEAAGFTAKVVTLSTQATSVLAVTLYCTITWLTLFASLLS